MPCSKYASVPSDFFHVRTCRFYFFLATHRGQKSRFATETRKGTTVVSCSFSFSPVAEYKKSVYGSPRQHNSWQTLRKYNIFH